MNGDVWYLDTSAFVKLLHAEAETPVLRAWLAAQTAPAVSSDVLRTEALRVARRVGPVALARCRQLLGQIGLLRVDVPVFEAAGELDPAVLRSLDALHLAAALTLGDDLAGVVTYDRTLQAAGEALGLAVSAPRP